VDGLRGELVGVVARTVDGDDARGIWGVGRVMCAGC